MLATPNTFTAKTRSHSSGVDVTTSPTAAMPALLHSTSTRPCSAVTRPAASAQACGSVTSKPSSRSRPTTVSPNAANASTIAVPIPPLAPVTTTTRSAMVLPRRRPLPSPSWRAAPGAAYAPTMTRITGVRTLDVRAPTSRTLAGSAALHTYPDHSGPSVLLATDGEHEGDGKPAP